MGSIKVEIGQYKEVNKGSIKANFSVIIHPNGQKILECRYFENDGKRWFSFPSKKVEYTDGRKTDYIPYISYLDKTYLEELKTSILEALQHVGKTNANSNSNQSRPNPVQNDTSNVWF